MEENCYADPIHKNMTSTEQLQNVQQLTLAVSEVGCPNCANRIRNKLISLEEVYGMDVYLHMALGDGVVAMGILILATV